MTADGDGISFWGDENVLELDRGAGLHNTVNVLNVAEFFTLKWVNCGFPGSPVVKTLLPVQWGTGSNPGQGTKIPCDAQHSQKIKKEYIFLNGLNVCYVDFTSI